MTNANCTNAQESRELFTVREMAVMTKTSTRTIYEMVRTGQLPAVRFGASIRLTWVDVVEARTVSLG